MTVGTNTLSGVLVNAAESRPSDVVDAHWRWCGTAVDGALRTDHAARSRPTRLPGWDVEALLRHTLRSMTVQAQALESALAGPVGTRATGEDAPPTPDHLLEELSSARIRLTTALERAEGSHAGLVVRLPYGALPLPLALDVCVMEAAVHRSDLAHALGADATLDPYAYGPTARTLQAFWPALAAAGRQPPAPVGIALRGEVVEICARFDGATWGALVGCPEAVIAGTDEHLLLYALGRAAFDELDLRVGGDERLARSFKELVPGP